MSSKILTISVDTSQAFFGSSATSHFDFKTVLVIQLLPKITSSPLSNNKKGPQMQ